MNNVNRSLKIYNSKIYFPCGVAVSAYSISTQKNTTEEAFGSRIDPAIGV
jgi:hypothetical protein